MNVMPIIKPLTEVEAESLAIAIFDKATAPPAGLAGTPVGDLLGRMIAADDLAGGIGDVTPLHGVVGPNGARVILFGLGPRETHSVGSAYSAAIALGKKLAAKDRGSVAVAVPEAGDLAAIVSAITEGIVVGIHGPG